ncbi:permease prefix domain 1-containing protein [Nonomuraea longispora]|uniref:permease prefix domain 1-containing protein n=1 Tax=Nonomuraea longispora TaxID=1848320 RepID=UPI0015F2B443|nr:permease prefix domain 1-containing protein [Nonomuraea longispora]
MVVEARDSLTDTADALEAEGLERAEAERVAVAEFGEVAEIASGYQAELTASAGRRLGVLMFAGLPITVLMWSLLWRAYPPSDDFVALTLGLAPLVVAAVAPYVLANEVWLVAGAGTMFGVYPRPPGSRRRPSTRSACCWAW